MRKKILRAICFIVILIFLFSGCSLIDFFSAESLLRPPRLTGENAALQKAFEEKVGKDIGLFAPLSGENRASYILFDSNNDGNDEAIVFYSLNSSEFVIHMHLLSQRNGEWYSVADITGSGTEIYKVDFYNVDNSRNLEIAVTWSVDDSKKDKTLSIYKIANFDENSDNALVSVASVQVADYICLDIDSDGISEVLYLYYKDSYSSLDTVARILDFDLTEQSFLPLSEVSLLCQLSSLVQICYEKQNNNYIVYFDCLNADGRYSTEILLFDYEKETLNIPLLDGVSVYSRSLRKEDVLCQDFDDDGHIDIPLIYPDEFSYMVGISPDNDISIELFNWYSYAEGSFENKGIYYLNRYDDYLIKADSLINNYYFVYDFTNKLTQVRSKDFDGENNIAFSVTKIIKTEFQPTVLSDVTTVEFNVVVTAMGETMNFTTEYIKGLISEYKEGQN